MRMLLTVGFMLGILAPSADLSQDRPALPGEAEHILKMTKEMIQIGTTRDPDQRVDLFLRAAEERVRELRAMDSGNARPMPRAVGWSYEALVGGGALGAIENGAAKGRDMSAASLRYAEATAKHGETWKRYLESLPPEERSAYDHALDLSQHGREHAQEAQERGRSQKNERERENLPPKPEGNKDKEKPVEPAKIERKITPEPRPEEEKKVHPEKDARPVEAERPASAQKEGTEPSRPKPAPPAHPHRPHR